MLSLSNSAMSRPNFVELPVVRKMQSESARKNLTGSANLDGVLEIDRDELGKSLPGDQARSWSPDAGPLVGWSAMWDPLVGPGHSTLHDAPRRQSVNLTRSAARKLFAVDPSASNKPLGLPGQQPNQA